MAITEFMTTREEATFFWLAIGLLACLFSRSIRDSFRGVAGALATPKVVFPILLFMAVICGATFGVDQLGYWERSLTGAVTLWFLFTGFRYLLGIAEAGRKKGFFREKVLEVIGVGAVFEFFLNIRTFSFFLEVPLILVVTILAMCQVLAGMKAETKSAVRPIRRLLSAITLALIVATVANLAAHRNELETHELVSLFLVPIWLTLVTLPFIYIVAVFAEYETLFVVMRLSNEDHLSWRSRVGAALILRGHLEDIANFRGRWVHEAASAQTMGGVRSAIESFRSDRSAKRAAETAATQRLINNAGMVGVDEDGRQLDEREFNETREALHWLATCHMGWYQREEDGGRYRADLLQRLSNDFTRQGLPQESGIVMRVSRDGQSWYAYRRTITGRVFAIGASEAPPSQWLYDSVEPPRGFPGKDKTWGRSMFETREENW